MQQLKSFWESLKSFCHYSASIAVARVTQLTGLLTIVFSSVDWSPVFSGLGVSTGFTWKQSFGIGLGIFVKGIIDELARRRTLKT